MVDASVYPTLEVYSEGDNHALVMVGATGHKYLMFTFVGEQVGLEHVLKDFAAIEVKRVTEGPRPVHRRSFGGNITFEWR